MPSRALRKTAAALIAAILFAFSVVPPAHAAPGRDARRDDDAFSRTVSQCGLLTILLRWIAKAGGAMDPNGNH